ncbi:hypothetical protein [Hyalangium versicolor]|uniref:hypothetical protein n=1 Tax=Hyalangium versicolor TaxID=2861190 RepID=UPI001CCB7E18|nr:hypothetical protein [Hyalangium versicolor]
MSTKIIKDPWGRTVSGGQFGYHSSTGNFVRVIPCGGEGFIPAALRTRLAGRTTQAVRHLVVNYDADADARTEPDARAGVESVHNSVKEILKDVDPAFTTSPEGDYLLDGGNTVVSVLVWWAPDAQAAGLPWKHTLERLVCASLNATFPGRAQAVEQWLQSRPATGPAGPKEYIWSNMAGWAAEKGCEAFFSALWSDPQVVTELQSRLVKTGAWRIAEHVAA